MIHPDTELRFINRIKGRGIFATRRIPKGTLTYVEDDLEIKIEPDDERLSDPKYRDIIETYSFIEPDGNRIISWDNAKYVNHCCQCNTMSTGYGFEIAIRDIAKDEEITDEYGMFNPPESMRLDCGKSSCRKIITKDDLHTYHKEWDQIVKSSLEHFNRVDQPLEPYLSKETENLLKKYFQDSSQYISVLNLAYLKED